MRILDPYKIAKGVGWDNVSRRVWHAFSIRSGLLRKKLDPEHFREHKLPTKNISAEQRIESWQLRRQRFFRIPSSEELRRISPPEEWNRAVTAVCDAAIEGRYPFFSRWQGELGWPPNFNLDPVNQVRWPVGEHWLNFARSGPPHNDIKLVWESSRCTLLYFLARQFVYSSEDKWAEHIWQFIESWIEQNPVNESAAWACGQETSFRIMAMLTSVITILDCPCTTEYRLKLLELLCWQSAKRIQSNLNYAISQENNHALSEAVGLWTIGLLFNEFPESNQWCILKKKVLESEVRRQIYSDGSYVQHSMTYHRVMLDDLCWAIELGRKQGLEFSKTFLARVTFATNWLRQFVNASNGRVPNYGANDGANVLPLACSDYLDFRPILHLASMVCGIDSGLKDGPWCEKACWLSDPNRVISQKPSAPACHWEAPIGGYYIIRGPASQLFIRAPVYRDRPGQCDTLHVDLWYQGWNILRDAGSYCYYHQEKEIKEYFYSASAHNTVQVSTAEQMTKGPNFLWFDWPIATGQFCSGTELQCKASFSGKTPYRHARTIRRTNDDYVISDEVASNLKYKVRWRLMPEICWKKTGERIISAILPNAEKISIQFSGRTKNEFEMSLVDSWESLYYGEKRTCPSVLIENLSTKLDTHITIGKN